MSFYKKSFALLGEAWTEFQKDEVEQRGAALAFYSMFSIFPLLLLLLAIVGYVLRHWDEAVNVRREILHTLAVNLTPHLSQTIAQILDVMEDKAEVATGFGVLTLFLGAARVLQQLDSTFKKIWKVATPEQPFNLLKTILLFLRDKFVSILLVLIVGLLLLVSLVLTGVTQSFLGWLADLPIIGGVAGLLIGLLVSILFNALIFSMMFKFLAPVRVLWSDVRWGALLTASIWEAAKILLSVYISRNNYVSAYGTVGAALALMAWVYFSSQILFFGAEFTESYTRRFGSRKGKSGV